MSNKASNKRQVSSYMNTNTGGHPAAFRASMVRAAVFAQDIGKRDYRASATWPPTSARSRRT